MKEFLLLFRGGDIDGLNQSPEKWQAHMQQWVNWMGELSTKGKLVGAQPLAQTGKIITGNKKVVSDGPFMEGKEMVGGYLILRAKDYDDAVTTSKGCPVLIFDDGIVEIREIQELKVNG
ncbi:MAG TPA: YciI family protein [Chryseosolibacter sp.]|nr:YciI family protein [Chryseosolibacter sp.]